MANLKKSVPENVPGPYFVDSTCIDCDTCRQLAPAVFGEAEDHAFVHYQPASTEDRRHALHALVCCPTGSIGCRGQDKAQTVLDDFPLAIEAPVFYCGFNSPRSFGGNSYFVRHQDGNWLIDSPKFLPRLVRKLHSLGGVANIFLTHRDDVADAQLYAREFGSRRFIHRAELSSQPDAETVLDGDKPLELRLVSSPSRHRAIPKGTASCSSRSASCSRATTCPGAGMHRRWRLPAIIAGIPGPGRSNPCAGSLGFPSSGCCQATASAYTCPTATCACGWRSW